MKIVFATNNKHKLEEAQAKLKGTEIEIISLEELGFNEEIEETAETIDGNAIIKAEYIFDKFNVNVFADDTGLEVESLNGAPGVYSSRYAGEHVTYEDNVNKLLKEMRGKENRNARFLTAICLILNGEKHIFHGIVNGKIIDVPQGIGGFGYDPVFVPDGYTETFAELPLEIKNKISHRGKALEELRSFLIKN
ncbi:non-canonical purine NTP diphosphatase [Odoribacter sp. OttesenSCG-928-L07]|nr:non-canonical purine NTP diphosphatase [Odoribacter sp. OttesenSCG-928-L07]MDL2239235.1 non-canonical purine NTP diphosphatase [Bacteroidales bacterium OttesenSCG-928-L14]MDL2240051.1 non-canonical purine NTP diphosphatase [Bacteroidales bacterium OttesenSCG-928-K22]